MLLYLNFIFYYNLNTRQRQVLLLFKKLKEAGSVFFPYRISYIIIPFDLSLCCPPLWQTIFLLSIILTAMTGPDTDRKFSTKTASDLQHRGCPQIWLLLYNGYYHNANGGCCIYRILKDRFEMGDSTLNFCLHFRPGFVENLGFLHSTPFRSK